MSRKGALTTTPAIQQTILDLLVQGKRPGEIKDIVTKQYNIAVRTCERHMQRVRDELANTDDDTDYWTGLITEMYKKQIAKSESIESVRDRIEQQRRITDSLARLRVDNKKQNIGNQYNIAVLIPEQRAVDAFYQATNKPDKIIDIEQE